MKESGQLSRILRRWLPDGKVCSPFPKTFYRLLFPQFSLIRLTVLVVVSSNLWAWRTWSLPSLWSPPPPSWPWSSSFGSWSRGWGSPGWSTRTRPRTITRPRLQGLLPETLRPSQVIEWDFNRNIFSTTNTNLIGGRISGWGSVVDPLSRVQSNADLGPPSTSRRATPFPSDWGGQNWRKGPVHD